MLKKYLVLCAMLMIAGCATNESSKNVKAPNLKERISAAAQNVAMVMPKNSDWCDAEKKCKFIGNISCATEGDMTVKDCVKKLRLKVIHSGGDTFVAQNAGIVPGFSGHYDENDYYRAYGKVYKCGDKFNKLFSEYKSSSLSAVAVKFSNVDFRSKTYVEQCKLSKSCKKVERKTCSTIRDDPFSRCVEKFERQFSAGDELNTIIVKQDMFNKMGAYRFFTEGYMCQ